jgi:RNA polymerase sigma-70 factor (ECF subfamily)
MARPNSRHSDRTETRLSFVERLRNWADDATWRQFSIRYGDLVHRVAMRAGLRAHEADEVVQETALSVARMMPEFVYEPDRCTFEGWVRRMARLRILDQLRRRGAEQSMPSGTRRRGGGMAGEDGSDAGGQTSDEAVAPGEDAWEAEWQQMLLDQALERLRLAVSPEHYQIFFLSFMEGRPVLDVARILDVKAAQVYLVRHRLVARLRKDLKQRGNDVEILPRAKSLQ